MIQPDEQYISINTVKQGTKFVYNNEQFLKIPEYVECYGNPANAVHLSTGTMTFFDNEHYLLDLETMVLEKIG